MKNNYSSNYILAELVKKGVGIHNGRLHRSLSQIQIRLFEEENGLNDLVSTSSIIEGVNTSAENVIIWSNKNGVSNLNNFTYKNIIGRGGRMFKHFIGKVYLLDRPPFQEPATLDLEFTDDLINSINKDEIELTVEQLETANDFSNEMDIVLGKGVYDEILKNNLLQIFSPNHLKAIAYEMRKDIYSWNGLAYLNSENPDDWNRILYKIMRLIGNVEVRYRDLIAYIKNISKNWKNSIPQILLNLQGNNITIERYFELERVVSFKIASMVREVNYLYNIITKKDVDVSSFSFKLSNAFLPRNVYELEEYGLPRMISKKIQNAGLINLEDNEIPLHEILLQLKEIGLEKIKQQIGENLHPFENYILNYFYDGIAY